MIPDSHFWLRLFGALAMEVAGIVLIAWAVTRFERSATVCRFVWRTALVCLVLVWVSDFSGVGSMVVDGFSRQSKEPPTQKFVLERPADGTGDYSQPVRFVPLIAPAPGLNSLWWVGLVWAIGCAALLARLLAAHGLLMVLRRKGCRLTDEVAVEEAGAISMRFGVRRRVVLIEGRRVVSPFAFGIFRAAIALPAGFGEKFRQQEREAILAHEMAHVAAGDPIWQLAANVVSALIWWHPAVWLARRWLYDATEMAADEAVSILENGPQTLAECLVAMARNVARPLWWGGVGMNGPERRSNLRRRVERLLNLRKDGGFVASAGQRAGRLMAAALFVFAAFLVSGFVQEKSGSSDITEVLNKSPLGVICGQIKARVRQAQAPLNAVLMLVDAKNLYEAGKFPEALARLQVALTIDPGNKAALYYRELVLEALRRNRSKYLDWNQPWLYPTYPPKLAQMSRATPVIVTPAAGGTPTAAVPTSESSFAATDIQLSAEKRAALATNLYWKQFHFDAKPLMDSLKRAGVDVSNTKMVEDALKTRFKAKVDWSNPRKSLLFNDRTGMLRVRATLLDLEWIERVVESTANQLTLEAEVAEIGSAAEKMLAQLGVDLKRPQVLDTQGWRELMDGLHKEPGANVLIMPKVTTLSERQARVSVADELPDGRKQCMWLTVLPKVAADRFSVELTAMFAKGTTKDENIPTSTGVARATVKDHGTLVFVCDVPDAPGKKDLVLVTATVIDGAGNAIHTDEQVKGQGRR